MRLRSLSLYVLSLLGLVGLVVTLQLAQRPARLDQRPIVAYMAAGEEGLQVVIVEKPDQPIPAGFWRRDPPVEDVASYGVVTYAAGGGLGLVVYDARDSAAPRHHRSMPVEAFTATRVAAAEGIGVLIDELAGARIYDLTDPFTPRPVGEIGVRRDERLRALVLQPPLLYLAGNQGLTIFDLSSPAEPKQLSALGAEALVVDFDVFDGLAYLIDSDSFAVVDVAEPTSPRLVGGAPLRTGSATSVAFGRSDAGSFAYIGATSNLTGGTGGLYVVDVSDPTSPKVGEVIDEDLSFSDIEVREELLFAAVGRAGLRVYELLQGFPVLIGQTSSQWPWFRLSLQTSGPMATATAAATATKTLTPHATEVFTPTATEDPSATPTVEPRASATATRERPPTPTATARATSTSLPSVLPEGWERLLPPLDVAATVDRASRLRFDSAGGLWLRLPRAEGPDVIITRDARGWRRYDDVLAVVRDRYDEIVRGGTLPEFWATDDQDRVWVGPRFFDGRDFTTLAADDSTPLGRVIHEDRAIVDRAGRAWVPYDARVACPNPAGCRSVGIRLFDPETGLLNDIELPPIAELGEYGIAEIMMLQGPTLPSAISAAARLQAQGDEQSYIVTSRAMYVPPSVDGIPYPMLDVVAGGETRNAGYASASAIDLQGRPLVITWVEEHISEAPRRVEWHFLANTWTGTEWLIEDLGLSPALAGPGEFLRVTAASFAPDGALWIGTSNGEVAVRRGGVWQEHFTAANSPLPEGLPITDITVSGTGTVWCVTPAGVFSYEAGGAEPVPIIYLPISRRQ